MKTNRLMSTCSALLSTAILIAIAPAAHASTPDFTYSVTLNVASLASNANGPFSLDFQLVTAAGNVANTVKISNFSTTGSGSGFGSTTYFAGNETGTIGSGIVTLTNGASDSDNELAASFNAGTQTITFNVDETPNADVTGSGALIPDQFNIAVLDSGLGNIPTTDPSTGNTLLTSALGEDGSFSLYSSLSPDGGVTITATPEPSSFSLSLVAAGGLLGLVLLRRRYTA